MAAVVVRRKGSRAARRDEIGNDLVQVLERLLENGESYAEISIERLVQEANISRSTFYVYFEDKGQLLLAWFDGVFQELAEASLLWRQLGADVTEPILYAVIEQMIEVFDTHNRVLGAVFEASVHDEAIRERRLALTNETAKGLAAHIKTGQREGFIDPELLPEYTADWLISMSERSQDRLRVANKRERSRLLASYARIIWNTLYAPTKYAANALPASASR